MRPSDDLLEALVGQLPEPRGLLLGIGDLHTIAGLEQRLPGLLALLPTLPQRRPRPDGLQRALRGDPLTLPLAPASLDGMIVVGTLSRLADPAAALDAWARHLRKGVCLLLAEPLIRSVTLRRIRGLLGGPRFTRPPEEITGLLLNAGFGEIGQALTSAGEPCFVTSGRWREL